MNLADPSPPPDTGTKLETAFDQALRMTVPVRIGSRGPYSFVVDTGANRSVVSQEVAAQLNLRQAGSTPVHGIAGVEPAGLVEVGRLRVGSVYSANLTLPVLPAARLGADGLLGVDVLKGRRVRLDFRANTFEIAASGYGAVIGQGHDTRIRDRNAAVTVPATYRFGQLVIFDAEVMGVPVSAFLDSGSQITVGNRALRDAIVARQPDVRARLRQTPLISATGQTAMAELAPIPQIRLGGLAITNLAAAFADLHIFDLWDLKSRPAVLVGVDVLRYFDDVILDFGKRQVIFTPPQARRLRLSGRG